MTFVSYIKSARGALFFKATYVNPSRLGAMVREADVEQYIGDPSTLEG